MRERKEIERDGDDAYRHGTNYTDRQPQVLLEVLLDIRDLLTSKNTEHELPN